eukprot:TRINITY_DN2628_c0_g1_i1.p1 TRINITY_DN2628_c0_g1~~TRINITY_DN2628_c0_g1_i1.p1  ORF type:complete len:413 (-),score=75.87 TRINITY_DN2628_c0_g1_i1:21-1124(-)
MPSWMDPFEVLGIPKTATEAEIKKAYRLQALKYHPDKLREGNLEDAECKFREATEAYQTLSNPIFRQAFDAGRVHAAATTTTTTTTTTSSFNFSFQPQPTPAAAATASGPAAGSFSGATDRQPSAEALYRQFFGPSEFTATTTTTTSMAGRTTSGSSDLEELLTRMFTPGTPAGATGAGQAPRAGHKRRPPISINVPCTLEELFNGTQKPVSVPLDVGERIVKLDIKRGCASGTPVKVDTSGAGWGSLQNAAELTLVITEKPHQHFRREGDDLHFTAQITLEQALSGCTVDVPLLSGFPMRVSINEIVSPGYVRVVPNEGMPVLNAPFRKGNLHIHFEVAWPRALSEFQKIAIRNARIMSDSSAVLY